jgi:hypothetical protein
MADEALGAQDAPTEQIQTEEPKQSVDDFIGKLLDEPADQGAATTAKAEESAPKEDSAEPETDIGEEDDTEETGEPEAKPSTIAAPQSMSAKDREVFNKLPPDQQQWLAERVKQMEADYTRKTMATAEKGKQFEQLDRVLAPHRQKFAHMGASEAQVVGQLLTLAEHADRDFVGFVQEQARLRGLPLTAFTQPGPQADPQLLATQRELQGVKNYINQQAAQQQAQQLQTVESAINEFVNEKAQDGHPAYPYYADLEDDMIPIVASLRQSKPGLQHREYLTKAYQMALAGNETVKAKADADVKAKAEAERVAKAKKAAAEAKKAAGTQPKTAGTLPVSIAKTRNIDEFIGGLVDERMRA